MLLKTYVNWPEATGWAFVALVIFFLLLYGFFVIIREKLKDDGRDEARWHIMQTYLNRHNLITPEINLIKKFFNGLSEEGKLEILDSKKTFREQIVPHLRNTQKDSPELIVTITDKLFPSKGHEMEVESLEDLYPGEMCALETMNANYLATVMKKTQTDFLLHVEDFIAENHLPEEAVSVYVFRPLMGGFLLSGILKEIGEDATIIHYTGQIKEKGEHHFMAELKVPVKFVPWPVDAKKSKTNTVEGESIKISDRAVLFNARYKDEVEFLARRNELWLSSFTLASGFKFSCRGMMVKSKLEPDKFIFKFLDAPETSRKVLFAEIRDNNPVREKLY
ncbi:MAG: hypothetical protein ABUK01_04285 [Leptospirales bacterium]